MTDIETMNQGAADQEQPEADAQKKGLFGRPKKPKKKKTAKEEAREWILTLGTAIVIALVVRGFLFEPVRVDGHSMDDTLQNGEVMFVTKMEYTTLDFSRLARMLGDENDGQGYIWSLFGEPERFDVVICHYPNRGSTNFVKRVVGLPGDTVEIKNGVLYVNGEMYEEPYITHRPDYSLPPYTVPEGKYFVLGDNRSNSNDSHLVGPIDRNMIIGHVRSVILPLGNRRTIE